MDLLVNVSTLTPPLTGIGRYTRYLLEQLMLRDEIEDLTGITALRSLDRSKLNNLLAAADGIAIPQTTSQTPGNRSVKQTAIQLARQIPCARSAKRLLERLTARRFSTRYRDHIYWEPNYLLLPIEARAVSTVYDLSHLAYPEHHPAERVRLLERNLATSIALSEKVVVISEFTRQEVMREFSLPADRLVVVPPAVSDAFRIQPQAQQLEALRHRYQLPERFLLSVGTLEPRKNLAGLARAFSRLPQTLRQACPLVLVGCKGWQTDTIEPILNQLETRGELIRLGYVAQHDLPLLFSAAQAMAYISFYEGYGMPVAEAMAAGTAVITSNRTSMPEVAAGAALLVDPEDQDQITNQLERLLEDEQLRTKQIELGLAKSAGYTWQASADTLFNALRGL